MFKPYLAEPEVTVIVEQINSQKFNILGRVAKPGSYPLVNPTTVLDAIALAGGCRDFAKQKSIYILRRHPDGTEDAHALQLSGRHQGQEHCPKHRPSAARHHRRAVRIIMLARICLAVWLLACFPAWCQETTNTEAGQRIGRSVAASGAATRQRPGL